MKIVVRSKSEARKFESDDLWACISISTFQDDWPKISKVKQLRLLQIAFADFDLPSDSAANDRDTPLMIQPNVPAFHWTHAHKVWDFVNECWEKVDLFMVHCEAGQSRSPAIAAAIAECKMNNKAPELWRATTPNMHVYRTMLNEWNQHYAGEAQSSDQEG